VTLLIGIVGVMTSLHISHTVRDFDAWLTAFNSFADFRTRGGVRALTVRHAVDDPRFVAIDLEFDTTEAARSFLERLETEIWPSATHLAGRPTARLLETVEAAV
jgi:hypothetical protein